MSARRLAPSLLLGPLLACAGGAGSGDRPPDAPAASAPQPVPEGSGRIEEFLSSATLASGEKVSVHVTPEQMPWRIAVPRPKEPPRYGSLKQGREAVIAAMQEWERALQTELPWFRLEFVEEDPEAPVRVVWKRRVAGPYQGFGGPRWLVRDGKALAAGELAISVRACELCPALDLDELRLIVAHEFGHVLGLGHCHECDSAMNYDWQTRGRAFVTRVDVTGVATLCAKPNPSAEQLLGPGGAR